MKSQQTDEQDLVEICLFPLKALSRAPTNDNFKPLSQQFSHNLALTEKKLCNFTVSIVLTYFAQLNTYKKCR